MMNRRAFLDKTISSMAGVAAAQSFSMSGAWADDHAPSIPIIDTHTHFFDPTRPQGVPWPPRNDSLLYKPVLPEHFQKLTQGLGVTGTVVVEASPWLEDNQWLLDLAAENPIIVGIVGNLEPGTADFKKHLDRFAASRLFRGIRLNTRKLAEGLARPEFVADLRRLAEADLQLDVVGGQVMLSEVSRLAGKAPDLRIVMDHLPFAVTEQEKALRPQVSLGQVAQSRNVFVKVSAVLRRVGDGVPSDLAYYRDSLDELWEAFGPDRLIYGSNWPVSDRIAPYAAVHQVVRAYFQTKGPDALEKYFWKNSLAAYRWVQRNSP